MNTKKILYFVGFCLNCVYCLNGSIVGFWHVYTKGEYSRSIVEEQKYVLEASGLIDVADSVFYTTTGLNGHNFTIEGEKFQHIKYFGLKADEISTLGILYDFCQNNTNSKVFYFHTKGSYNYHLINVRFRKALDCFVLNPHCLKALDTHDVCGWRYSPVPHPHYSGNFWWATCKHINRLVHPLSFSNNKTFVEVTKTIYKKNWPEWKQKTSLGVNRFFSETWIGTYPLYNPADCVDGSKNSFFIMGYRLPWDFIHKTCENAQQDYNFNPITQRLNRSNLPLKLNLGLDCDKAAVIRQPEMFLKPMIRLFNEGLLNYSQELIKRSLVWYGDIPHTQINTLKPYRAKYEKIKNQSASSRPSTRIKRPFH